MKKLIAILSIIFVIICIGTVIKIKFSATHEFNQEIWNTDIRQRKRMVEDLIINNQIIGKSKTELKNLLGENYKIADSETSLGYVVSHNIGDPLCFIISFDDNEVAYKYDYATP